MSKGLVALGGVGIILALVAVWFFMGMHYRNAEVGLRNGVTAQQKANEASHDTMWKIISQKAQITSEYKDTFSKVYPEIIAGRYGNEKGGSLMKFITEANPNFDISLYKDLMVSIEAERKVFFRNQERLIDLKREHDDVLAKEPGRWFVGDRPKIEIKVVTSSRSDAAFQTGKDDEVDLFKKSPAPVEKK